jgi:methionine biosynthesis protein MetW
MLNYSIISEIIEPGAKVLDLGCGDGQLLKILQEKCVRGAGVEIDQNNVIQCIEKGLSVIQGDIDTGLVEYADKSYDYVVLNQTLQSTHRPDFVIKEMLRVGKKCIVSFPNFGYWRVRLHLLFKGTMPKSKMLPYEWYDTPNIHLLTVKDFSEFAKRNNFKILKTIALRNSKLRKGLADIFTEEVIYIIANETCL